MRIKITTLFSSLLWCLFFFVAICVIFSQRLELPGTVKVMGRLHPLVIHFPLVLSICISLIFIVPQWRRLLVLPQQQNALFFLVGANALFALLSVLFGLFLSREGGYDEEALQGHKWAGVCLAAFSYLFFLGHKQILRLRPVFFAAVWLFPLLAIWAGHMGGNITHGSAYLLEPMEKNKQPSQVNWAKANVFEAALVPILEEKCISCHSEQKTKGGLKMSTLSDFEKGGRHGAPFKAGDPENSLIWKYINQPEEDKKHMPPAGKPQLTEDEKKIILAWLQAGIDLRSKWTTLADTSTLRKLVQQNAQGTAVFYAFEPANPATVQQLSNFFRVIAPIYEGSPALYVRYYGKEKFNTDQITALQPIAKQVVQVDLHNMPVQDDGLKALGAFQNLENLNLNYTQVTGAGLKQLSALKNLKQLSLAGVSLQPDQLGALAALPALQNVYIWNTGLDSSKLNSISKEYPKIRWMRGFDAVHATPIPLNAPLLTASRIIFNTSTQVTASHPVKGVSLRYTLDETEPDSAFSPLAGDLINLDHGAVVKVRAFKSGWLGSPASSLRVYKTLYRADSIQWTNPPSDARLAALGPQILIDTLMSDEMDFRNGKWIGSQKPLELLIRFEKPVDLSAVDLSGIVNTGAYIFPPEMINISGGLDPRNMHALYHGNPAQPEKDNGDLLFLDLKFKTQRLQYLKIQLQPVGKLPKWHSGKGKPGWIFLDELLFN